MTTELHIDAIIIEGRHRYALGDIKSLAGSIDTIGLIHPVVVTPDNRLVAGERRLAALRSLGWEQVPVTVIHTLADAADHLMAESDENTCRKDFAPTEALAIADAVEEALRPIAEAARVANLKQNRGANVAPRKPVGKTRDVAAKATGLGRTTITKVREVKEIVENPATPEPVREAAKNALTAMDKSGNVSGAHKIVKDAQRKASAPQPDPRIGELIGDDADVQLAKYRHQFSKAMCQFTEVLSFDADRLAPALSPDDWSSTAEAIDAVQRWWSRVESHRPDSPRGLKVVGESNV